MKTLLFFLPLFLFSFLHTEAQICNPAGNVVIYSNYDGGVLNIDVNQNIPNLKIGICTYEAVTVNITGAFVGNIVEVIYAGFDGTNNPCGNNPPTTVINGVPASIVTMYSQTLGNIAIANYLGEPIAPGFPALVNCITGADGACSSSNGGGGNSAPQIVQFFLAEFGTGSVLFSHFVQYNCFSGTYFLNSGGNCCLETPTTPPNPIYAGNGTYNFIIPTDTMLCSGSITFDLSFYEVLYQPPTYPGYTWSDGTTGPIITITTPGTYYFTVGDYCHYDPSNWLTDTIVVLPCCTQPPAPLVNPVSFTYCETDPLNPLTATAVNGGTLTWYSNASLSNQIGTGASLNPSTNPGSTIYYVTETDNGCEGPPSSITVTIDTIPNFTVSSSTGANFICAGTSINLSSSASSGNAWSTGSTNPSISISSSGTYTLTVSNGACSADTSIVIVPGIIPNANITGDSTSCQNASTNLTASGGTSYLWSNGQTGATFSSIINNSGPVYVVVNNGQCSDTAVINIVVFGSPTVNAGTDQTINIGSSVQLSATSSGNTYSWSPSTGLSCVNCANPVASPSATTSYIVTVTDANGCTRSDTVIVIVDIICAELFVPSAFSPNEDGNNDEICVENNCISEALFRVYNRWGELVYETTTLPICWDGKYKDALLPVSAYAFTLNATLYDGNKIIKNGHIALIK